jgi:hypothetical protein
MATEQARFVLDRVRQVRQRAGLLGHVAQVLEDVLKLPDDAPPPSTDEG